jgi:hypothetical protein
MNLSLGEIEMPVAALSVFDVIPILILVPVFDRFIYPACKSIGFPLTMLMKIQIGFFVALLSMITAGVVEQYRLQVLLKHLYFMLIIFYSIQSAPPPGNYTNSPSAIRNISPCQNIDDYNPYQYQSFEAGLIPSSQAPAYCSKM